MGRLGQLAPLVPQVLVAHQVLWVFLVRMVQVDRLDPREIRAKTVLVVLLESLVHLDPLVHLGQLD